MKGAIKLGIAIAVFLAISAGVADAGKTPYSTAITARFDTSNSADYIKGSAFSDKSACSRRRTVQILRDADWGGPGGFVPFGEARTNAERRYRFDPDLPIPNGDYVARLPRKENRRFVCRASRSKPVFVD